MSPSISTAYVMKPNTVGRTCGAPRNERASRGAAQLCPTVLGFITFAVEIEDEAPLYFFAEAVDD